MFSCQQFVTEKENYMMNSKQEVKRSQKVFYFDGEAPRKATVVQVFKTNTWHEADVVIVKNGDGTKNITWHYAHTMRDLIRIMTYAEKPTLN